MTARPEIADDFDDWSLPAFVSRHFADRIHCIGGTALARTHLTDGRLSEDIDFEDEAVGVWLRVSRSRKDSRTCRMSSIREVWVVEDDLYGGQGAVEAAKYRGLISDFVDGRISGWDFETPYLKLFQDDASLVAGDEFRILEDLFFAVDDYVDDPELRARVGGLDGEQLRAQAREAHSKLYVA